MFVKLKQCLICLKYGVHSSVRIRQEIRHPAGMLPRLLFALCQVYL